MKKSEKIFLVKDLTTRLNGAKSVVLADITGLKVGEQEKLRRMLREVGGKLMIVKNTLLGRAIQTSNLKSLTSNIQPSLVGQTAVIISEQDELSPIQILGKFIKEFERPLLKLGIVSGEVADSARLLFISKLPSREVLLGQLLGVLGGPMYGLVGTLQGNMGKLVYILNRKVVILNGR